MKKCKVCGDLTDTVFNINLKATPICEECARRIFLQQATWYTQQEFKNLALPHVINRRELLIDFRKWWNYNAYDYISDPIIDKYIEDKSINSL